MTLAEIADASGIPARTIRFYIARGLLNGPAKAGRNAEYTADHLERLEQIKSLQADGHMLADIARLLSGDSVAQSEVPHPAAWLQHVVADDVMVWVRAGASPWRTRQVQSAVEEFARRVKKGEES